MTNDDINKVELYNIEGEKVYMYKSINKIDSSKLLSGIYFIKIQSENSSFVQKLVKL